MCARLAFASSCVPEQSMLKSDAVRCEDFMALRCSVHAAALIRDIIARESTTPITRCETSNQYLRRSPFQLL
jgi:hypothetical protein